MENKWWEGETPAEYEDEWLEIRLFRARKILQITRKKIGPYAKGIKTITIHRKGMTPEAKALLEEFLALRWHESEQPAPEPPPGWSRK